MVGEDVLIAGAGPVGLMAAAIARHVGARHVVITDINDYRLQLAKKMGFAMPVNPLSQTLTATMKQLNMQEGFDIGLEMSGNPHAVNDMIQHMNYGGKIAFLGIPSQQFAIDWSYLVFKSLTIKGIYGRQIFETWYKMTSMLESGLKIVDVITHHFPYHDFKHAFDTLLTGQAAKVILNWQ